jgi:integrase
MLNYCLIYEEDYPLEYNPCSHLKKISCPPRSRYLTHNEIIRLIDQLEQIGHDQYTDLFKLALFTGARISNVKAMRWDELDLEEDLWHIPAIKTKTNKTYNLPISSLALVVLLARKKKSLPDSVFVFPSNQSKSGYIMGSDYVWKQVITKAGLYSSNRELRVRQHDLRRTFATLQALNGVDINVISKTLGHSDIKSTQVYAHINLESAKNAIEKAFSKVL